MGRTSVVKQIKALTPGGEGVHAVFDGVGKVGVSQPSLGWDLKR